MVTHLWKNGTVRKIKNGEYKQLHNALFIGILGDPKPKYVAAVIIREPKVEVRDFMPTCFGEFLQHTMRIDDIKYAGTD